MHICIDNLTISGSENGLSPGQQANVAFLLVASLGANFSEILIEFIHYHSRKCI